MQQCPRDEGWFNRRGNRQWQWLECSGRVVLVIAGGDEAERACGGGRMSVLSMEVVVGEFEAEIDERGPSVRRADSAMMMLM